jgi:quinol monooxygenase YgiN
MSYAVAVTWRAKEGEEERVAEILQAVAPACRAEPGCRMYQAHRSPDDARTFFLYELYDDEEAFRAHGQTEHYQTWVREQALPLLVERVVTKYETLD